MPLHIDRMERFRPRIVGHIVVSGRDNDRRRSGVKLLRSYLDRMATSVYLRVEIVTVEGSGWSCTTQHSQSFGHL
jgi:hypothetical protein